MNRKLKALCAAALAAFLLMPLTLAAALEDAPGYYTIGTETAEMDGKTYKVITMNVADKENIFLKMKETFLNIKDSGEHVKIVIPPGTYYIDKQLHMYGNTWIYMPNVTIAFSGVKLSSMLRNGLTNETIYGYDYKDITVQGGTWSSKGYANDSNGMTHFVHVENLKFDGVTFTSDHGGHYLEVSAVKNFTVKNCTFSGRGTNSLTSNEAIQLEVLYPDCTGSSYGAFDGTETRDVYITNNKFINTTSGVGTHSAVIGKYFYNINIIGNQFTNIPAKAIIATNYKGAVIKDNVITAANMGIVIRSLGFLSGGAINSTYLNKSAYVINNNVDTLIENNTITILKNGPVTAEAGIRIQGCILSAGAINSKKETIPSADYRVSGLTICNNTINTPALGIIARGLMGKTGEYSYITGNTIVQTATPASDSVGYNIQLTNQVSNQPDWIKFTNTGVTINNNMLDNTNFRGYNGITIRGGSGCIIDGNTIIKPSSRGIYITESTAKHIIKNNIISDTDGQGISINKSTATISHNTLSDTGSGIAFYSSSKGTADGNIITRPVHGIYSKECKNTLVFKNNVIKKASRHGICVISGNATIASNTITSPSSNGIDINSTSKTLTIKNNVITYSGVAGICMEGGGANIYSNTITGHKGNGIYLRNCQKRTSQIYNNKITSSTKAGATTRNIFILSGLVSRIEGNACSGWKYIGIDLNPKSTGASIKDNSFNDTVAKNLRVQTADKNYSLGTFKTGTVSAKKKTSTSIKVSWGKVADATGYVIYRSTSKTGTYKNVKTITSGSTLSWTNTKLAKGKKYYFKVYAYRTINKNKVYSIPKTAKYVKLAADTAEKTAKAASGNGENTAAALASDTSASSKTKTAKTSSGSGDGANSATDFTATKFAIGFVTDGSSSSAVNGAELALAELRTAGYDISVSEYTSDGNAGRTADGLAVVSAGVQLTILASDISAAEYAAGVYDGAALVLFPTKSGETVSGGLFRNVRIDGEYSVSSEAFRAFAESYAARFGVVPDSRAAIAYAATKLAASAVSSAAANSTSVVESVDSSSAGGVVIEK